MKIKTDIHNTVIKENPNDLYWWAKWPKNPTKEEQEAIYFLLTFYPKTISIGVQKVADLMVAYYNYKNT